MNYIELNGVKSTSIKGLLIQALPPIIKPMMRTETEEIGGRDGDKITKLGYSAYNREMLIGLYGDFDIDDVIGYFDSEGKVIFSNEPDKYYRYQITDAISFERLLRFRTATITFHVQPFKYSAIEKVYSFNVSESKSFDIHNSGNTNSKPVITLYGSGTVLLTVNGAITFSKIDLSDIGQITIDAEKMNAYMGETLMNRRIVGDYDNLVLNVGKNTIAWGGSGMIDKISIENFSRWI